MFNVSYSRNGGLRFVKIGRVFFSFGLSKAYRPLGTKAPRRGRSLPMLTGPSRCSLATLAGLRTAD